MGEMTEELAWLDLRGRHSMSIVLERTWAWWREYHKHHSRTQRQEASEMEHRPSMRAWMQTCVRHKLAALEIERDIAEGRINGDAVREVRRG